MASKYRKKFSLPEEFYPILEAYSREVLRDQPLDIIEYSYLYFKHMEEVSLTNHISSMLYRELSTNLTTLRRERTFLHPSTGDQSVPSSKRNPCKCSSRSTMTNKPNNTVRSRTLTVKSTMTRMVNLLKVKMATAKKNTVMNKFSKSTDTDINDFKNIQF